MPEELINAAEARRKRRQEVFLAHLSADGRIEPSARAAGYTDASYLWRCRKKDPEFAEAWEDAVRCAVDKLYDSAFTRALDGVEKGIYYKGDLVGTETIHSDRLTMFLLSKLDPDRFGDKQKIEANVTVGIAVVPATAISVNEWQERAEAMHKAQSIPDYSKVVDAEFEEMPKTVVRA